MRGSVLAWAVVVGVGALGVSAPAWAQRVRFERAFDVGASPSVDVSTIRGSIDISRGDDRRVVVDGEVVVRIGWNVPADAGDVAVAVAAAPPVRQAGDAVRVRPPDEAARRAVTVSYRIRVPAGTRVVATTESGATSVTGVSEPVVVRSQSGAVTIADLAGSARVTTGSAGVSARRVRGALDVTTGSGAITGRALGGALHARTSSGSIEADWATPAGADVRTASSSIELRGTAGPVAAESGSGHITVTGSPRAPWRITAGSGSVELAFPRDASATIDASSRSGSVTVRGADLQGTIGKHDARGTIGGGGASVRVTSRSGSIRIDVGL